jgi:hypothetical protein
MAKKVVLIVLGAVALVMGLGAVMVGGVLAAFVGSDDTVHSGAHQIGTPTTALVSPTERVSHANPLRSGIGAVTITMTAHSPNRPVFVGVARADDVDRYLNQVAFDEVTDFTLSPYRVQTVRHEGSRVPDPPTQQSFWVATATGSDATLQWRVTEGDYRLVVLNANAARGVSTTSQFGVKIGALFGIAVAVVLLGGLLAVIGAVLLVWGIRTPATGARPPPGPVPAAPPGPGA